MVFYCLSPMGSKIGWSKSSSTFEGIVSVVADFIYNQQLNYTLTETLKYADMDC